MRILILGASGMLGNAMYRLFSESGEMVVFATARSSSVRGFFPEALAARIVVGVDVENHDSLDYVFAKARPDVVINCVGLVKQIAEAEDPLQALPINAMLPHRLARMCELTSARLVQISTDCVFSGARGNYRESDQSDAADLYGRSKFLGEVEYPNSITLRTSIIGHELVGHHSLIGWFLAQEGKVMGYTKAIFSGLPTVELARVTRDFVIPNVKLSGLYHVAAAPISKFDLLQAVALAYGKKIVIEPDDKVVVDRSLNSDRFREATGYVAPPWTELVTRMREFH